MTYLKNNVFLSIFKNNFLIYLCVFFPYLMSRVIKHEKLVYIVSALLLFLIILLLQKKDLLSKKEISFISNLNSVSIYLIYFGLFIGFWPA